MEKRVNKNKKDHWEEIPDTLKELARINCIDDDWCDEGILKYLIKNIYECDSVFSDINIYDVIRYIDFGVACFFPLWAHEDVWEGNIQALEQILDRSSELMEQHFPADYKIATRTISDEYHNVNYVRLSQRLSLFQAVLYMYKEDWNKLQGFLDNLVRFTAWNVREILNMSEEDALEYASWDDFAEDIHYDGSTEEWLILDWLVKESIPRGKATMYLTRAYSKYVEFLYRQENTICSKKALRHLQEKANTYLTSLIEDVCEDGLEKDMEVEEYPFRSVKEVYNTFVLKATDIDQKDESKTGVSEECK